MQAMHALLHVAACSAITAAYVLYFNRQYEGTDTDCCVFTAQQPVVGPTAPHRVLQCPLLPEGSWRYVMTHLGAVPGIPQNPRESPWSCTRHLLPPLQELRFRCNSTKFEKACLPAFWVVQEGVATFSVMSPRATDNRVIAMTLRAGEGLQLPKGWWFSVTDCNGLIANLTLCV